MVRSPASSTPAPTAPLRLLVLASGSGTLLQSLLDACADGGLAAAVVAVGADREGTRALARAGEAGVAGFVVPLVPGGDRTAWDVELTTRVAEHRPDLVVCAGFMKLLGPAFLARFGGRTINSHPALLPSFPGMHGPRDALAHGVKVTGATVFWVDAGVDTGAILAQRAVDVLDGDDAASLHERIKVVEREILVATVAALAARPRGVAPAPGSAPEQPASPEQTVSTPDQHDRAEEATR